MHSAPRRRHACMFGKRNQIKSQRTANGRRLGLQASSMKVYCTTQQAGARRRHGTVPQQRRHMLSTSLAHSKARHQPSIEKKAKHRKSITIVQTKQHTRKHTNTRTCARANVKIKHQVGSATCLASNAPRPLRHRPPRPLHTNAAPPGRAPLCSTARRCVR